MLEAKTKKQKEFVRRIIVDECPCGNSVLNVYEEGFEADIASLSFDSLAKIVDYLRKENEVVEIPTTCRVSADSDGVVYCLYDTPHEDVIQFCKKLAWVNGKDFGYYYEQFIANGRIVIQNK
jgi:hypothetical protein